MPEHDALGVDLRHRLRRVDPAAGEEEPQVGTPPGRDELRLGAASAVARVVEKPVPDPDLERHREVDPPRQVVVVDEGRPDIPHAKSLWSMRDVRISTSLIR